MCSVNIVFLVRKMDTQNQDFLCMYFASKPQLHRPQTVFHCGKVKSSESDPELSLEDYF